MTQTEAPSAATDSGGFLGLSAYQWLVLFAAWLGWGFDVFDALLFNYVARLCIPSLLGPGHNDPQTLTHWVGMLTSVLLVGWGMGGILFGKLTDRLGRTQTLLLTMLTYALATAVCAFAPNIWVFVIFRFIASLGIGGEWAAGAALVAETVPENKRVHAGALLYTAALAGLFFATLVTDIFTRQLDFLVANPELSWRAVYLTGLLPAAAALLIRLKVREPDVWRPQQEKPRVAELFAPDIRKRTLGGLAVASIALITWWSCSAFAPVLASFLAADIKPPPVGAELAIAKARLVTLGTTWFNFGGLLGTLLTIPVALTIGRRKLFIAYFAFSALSIGLIYRLPLEPELRLGLTFFSGLTVFGIFGAFPFYLPELFPTRLRGTGSGFCYNTGRFITAVGPFVVGTIAQGAKSSLEILHIISWVAVVPLVGVLLLLAGWGEETKDRSIREEDKRA
jgi:MFS family permease